MKRPVVVTITIVDADTLGEIGRATEGFPVRDDLLTGPEPDKDQDVWQKRIERLGTAAYCNAFARR